MERLRLGPDFGEYSNGPEPEWSFDGGSSTINFLGALPFRFRGREYPR